MRCFSDAMCKGNRNGTMVCNAVGVNECREKGTEGDRCRRTVECAAGYSCETALYIMILEESTKAIAMIAITILTGAV